MSKASKVMNLFKLIKQHERVLAVCEVGLYVGKVEYGRSYDVRLLRYA